jgi:uncharacterized integral membrane protein
MTIFKAMLLALLLAVLALFWRANPQPAVVSWLDTLHSLPLSLVVAAAFGLGMLAGASLLSLVRPRRQPDKWC